MAAGLFVALGRAVSIGGIRSNNAGRMCSYFRKSWENSTPRCWSSICKWLPNVSIIWRILLKCHTKTSHEVRSDLTEHTILFGVKLKPCQSSYSILIHKFATEISVNNISYRFKTGSSLSVSFHQHSLFIQVFHSSITNTIWSQFTVLLNKKTLSLQKFQINNVLSCTGMKWKSIFWHMCEFCRHKTNTFYTTVRLLWYYRFINTN